MRTVTILTAIVVALLAVAPLWAAPPQHPISKPQAYTDHASCEFCGMNRNAFARTRYVFADSQGEHYVCSIHCVAAMSRQSGEEPTNVRVALYLDPKTMILVENAVYVIGSSAAGTMTAKSKLAFADRKAAEQFAAQYGGTLADFATALAAAKEELGSWSGRKHGNMTGMNHDCMNTKEPDCMKHGGMEHMNMQKMEHGDSMDGMMHHGGQ